MRTILRAAGWTARGVLWIVKGLLLLLAVATLVLWPMSGGREVSIQGDRYTEAADWVHRWSLLGACDNGLMVVQVAMIQYDATGALESQWPITASGGSGWKWELDSSPAEDDGRWLNSSLGPLRWEWVDVKQTHFSMARRIYGLPCWLLAPLLALWPLTSIVLFARRRTRRRRLLAVGCCLSCGYDLRATPSPGGQTLARCPECGTPAAAPVSQPE